MKRQKLPCLSCPLLNIPLFGDLTRLLDIDYMWRPTMLGVLPWYFFAAMCECTYEQLGALPWHSFQNSDGAWKHHPFFSLVRSKLFPETVLLDEQGLPFLTTQGTGKQMYYCSIITHQAWGVPLILAEFPKTPRDTSSSSQKGYFALFMLLLFHPWRHLQTDLFAPAFANVLHPFDSCLALHGYFQTWYNKQVALETQVKHQYAEQGLAVTQEEPCEANNIVGNCLSPV